MPSTLSVLGLTGETEIILVRSKAGDCKGGIERGLLESGFGNPRFFEMRPPVYEAPGVDTGFNIDLVLRLADGDSSITLSLSPSRHPGDAKIGDNLLLARRFPKADPGIAGLTEEPG
jgi:hypothetical protein